jgi:hypothetical protein
MVESIHTEKRSFEVEIIPASSLPQAQVRAKVKAAIEEAGRQFQKQHDLSLEISGAADGGLFDLGAAWPWVIHLGGHVLADLIYKAGEEAVKEVGKEGGESFYSMLKEALRKRNLTMSAPHDLRLFPDPNHQYASLALASASKPAVKKRASRRKPVSGRKTNKRKTKKHKTKKRKPR